MVSELLGSMKVKIGPDGCLALGQQPQPFLIRTYITIIEYFVCVTFAHIFAFVATLGPILKSQLS